MANFKAPTVLLYMYLRGAGDGTSIPWILEMVPQKALMREVPSQHYGSVIPHFLVKLVFALRGQNKV